MFRAFYMGLALLIIGGYAFTAYRGMEISTARKRTAPAGIRGRAGGVAPVYWYGGYRGGK